MAEKKNSLGDQVFVRLREEILTGKRDRGEELTEVSVGTDYGVSRTPVREALRRLELEGLVEIIPNKGAFVTGISPDDVRDIYSIRSKLEGLCARWAAKRITKEQLEEMEETAFLSEYHAKKDHYDQVTELDSKFHNLLYKACGSKILAHSLSDYHQYVKMVRKISVATRLRSQKSNEEHHRLLDALREHDEDKAEKLATQHIINTIQNLSHYDLEELLK